MSVFNEDARRIYQLLTPHPPELLSDSHLLIKEGPIIVLSSKHGTGSRLWRSSGVEKYGFLFNDCFLIAERIAKDKYRLRTFVQLRSGMSVVRVDNDPTAFQLKAPTKVITMSGLSVEDTTVWVSLFQASLATLQKSSKTDVDKSPEIATKTSTKQPIVASGSITTSGGSKPSKTVIKIETPKHEIGNKTTTATTTDSKGKSAGGSFSFNLLKQFTLRGEKSVSDPSIQAKQKPNVYVCDESVQESNEPRSPNPTRAEPAQVQGHQQVLAGQLRKQIVEHQKDIRKSMLRSQRLEQAVVVKAESTLNNNDTATVSKPNNVEGQRSDIKLGQQSIAAGLLSCRPKSVYYVPSLSTDDLMGAGSRLSVYGYYGMDDLVSLANGVDIMAYMKSNGVDSGPHTDVELSEKQVLPAPEISPLDDMELMDLDGTNIVLDKEIFDATVADDHHSSQFRVWRASIEDHPIILRQIVIPSYEDSKAIWEAFKTETRMLKSIQHPNLVKYLGVYYRRDKNEINLLTEYLEGGSLSNIIKHDGPTFTERFCAHLTFQILEALAFLHRNHLIHRNLTPNNVLFNKHGNVKLTDYCTSEKLIKVSLSTRKSSILIGSPWYTAPETIESEAYTPQMDSWSVGCIVYHLLTGKKLFDDYDAAGAAFQVIEEEIPLPQSTSDSVLSFLKDCFTRPHDKVDILSTTN
eukprot:TRINITY_DN2168_c0_g1_i1.p1 TRINITY_DN2168_c0_g1~~TRINITY_DN2168_c0_g1_i1.p1  ORF type:complete len:699 (-),score=112.28 TRINITY_DN2168_c0_g1_i1:624-2693(-)